MTRLVIIGNSHVGALKRAWNELASRPKTLDVSFFAVPDKQQRFFRLGRDRVYGLKQGAAERHPVATATAVRINGSSAIDLSGADAVVRCGVSVFHQPFSQVAATYDVEGYRAVGAARRMSRAAFEAFCDDLGRESLPPATWSGGALLRRVAVLPRPLPAAGATATTSPDFAHWRTLAARPDGVPAMLDRLFAGMAAAHAERNIDFLPQPAATIEATGLTAEQYTKGSVRLVRDEHHPEQDVTHMNASYGALCLRSILDWADQGALIPA